jgi:hypothetical protein
VDNLSKTSAEFAGRISVAVWIGRLTDAAAREALGAYAAACHSRERIPCDLLHEAVLAEYCHRREGQDLCS